MYPTESGKIHLSYGVRGSHWAAGYHTGTDFEANVGTPIYATKPGVVVFAGYHNGWGAAYGYHVVVSSWHNDHLVRHMYAHLSHMDVGIGERVKGGERLGLSGNSGNTTGPHLHYEERVAPFGYYDNKAPVLLSWQPPAPKPLVSVSKLKPGKINRDVLKLKKRLNEYFPKKTPLKGPFFGKELRARYAEFQRNLGYKGDNANGIPGWTSLKKLGFRVKK